MADFPSLGGRGMVTRPSPMARSGPHRLWHYFGEVPMMKSLLVYNNGTVKEGVEFTVEQITDPAVHTYIRGGCEFRAENGSWLYTTLTAAGYWFSDQQQIN